MEHGRYTTQSGKVALVKPAKSSTARYENPALVSKGGIGDWPLSEALNTIT